MTDRLSFQLETEQRLKRAIGEELFDSYPNWKIRGKNVEDKCKCKDCRALENEIIMLGSILEWIGEIIKGNKVSDFALSFPLVRQVYDRLEEG